MIEAQTKMSSQTADQTSNNEPHKKRSRLGKCARRRKRKAQAILDAAAASLSSSSSPSSSQQPQEDASSRVPSDRGYVLEGVKIRRREELRRRRCRSLPEASASQVEDDLVQRDTNNDDADDEDEDAVLDARDEHQLRLQLGFLPGNAICVTARLSSEMMGMLHDNEGDDGGGMDDEGGSSEKKDSHLAPPSVLKLYPMAVRESYRGGKTDGRAFKGRRRGAMRVEESQDGGATESTDGQKKSTPTEEDPKPKEKCKKERAWVVESCPASNSHQSNNDNVTSTTISPQNNEPNNPNQNEHPQKQQQQQQSPQQIIEPFPTLYWLTSPLLRTLISKLEISKHHNVPQMEAKLRSSPSYLEQMERAHKSYGRRRWELLTPADQSNIVARGWQSALGEGRGVAGIRLAKERYDCVKCLHAHAAHYLAQVEEWVLAAGAKKKKSKVEGKEEEEEEDGKDKEWTMERMMQECDLDDLNLVGKWTMESVLDMIKKSAESSSTEK